MNTQDHPTQDQSPLKRKYDQECDTQDQPTQDQSPIKRKYYGEQRNGNFIIHNKLCTCCKRMVNEISEYKSIVTRECYQIDGG